MSVFSVRDENAAQKAPVLTEVDSQRKQSVCFDR